MLNIAKTIEDYSEVSCVALYKEDLLQIEEILSNKVDDLEITYTTAANQEHSVKSLKEISDKAKIKSINLRVKSLSMTVRLSRYNGLTFSVWEKSDKAYAAILTIMALASNNRSKVRIFVHKYMFLIGIFLFTVPSLIVTVVVAEPNKTIPAWQGLSLMGAIILGVILLGAALFMLNKQSFFTLSDKGAANFFKRNQDKIFVGIFVGVVVAIVTTVINMLSNQN